MFVILAGAYFFYHYVSQSNQKSSQFNQKSSQSNQKSSPCNRQPSSSKTPFPSTYKKVINGIIAKIRSTPRDNYFSLDYRKTPIVEDHKHILHYKYFKSRHLTELCRISHGSGDIMRCSPIDQIDALKCIEYIEDLQNYLNLMFNKSKKYVDDLVAHSDQAKDTSFVLLFRYTIHPGKAENLDLKSFKNVQEFVVKP